MNSYIFNKKHIIQGIVIKILAIISAIYGLIVGIKNSLDMTYFTNLSNILIMLALLAFLVMDIVILLSKGEKNPKKNYMFIVKFALTLCISITWIIYMCILAPTSEDGFLMSYTHNYYGSFCLHMFTPVLAIVDFLLYDYNYESSGKHVIYAILPPLLYVCFVVFLASTGVRWGDGMSAPYNFLNFGAETGWFGFDLSKLSSNSLGIGVAYMIFVLVLFFAGLGRLFLLFNKLIKNKLLEASK